MADKDARGSEPSLELPSFLGRRKRTKEQHAAPVEDRRADVSAARAPALAEPSREPREFKLPAVPAVTAVLITGAVIGLLAVVFTFLSLQLCELINGTTSCGGPGLLLLVAILIGLTYLGGWLLRSFGVDDPGSTSFLAVGLMAVVAMLFLIDVLFAWWMVIVIPMVGTATFALSWWVTTSMVEVE